MSGMFRISGNLAKMSALKNRKVEPSLFKGGGSVFWIYEGRLGVLFERGSGKIFMNCFLFLACPFSKLYAMMNPILWKHWRKSAITLPIAYSVLKCQ